MKIVIIGAGKVGSSIINKVSMENHEVVVIDNKPSIIEKVANKNDVMAIYGNGVSLDILKQAGVNKADLFISVTASDEVNLLACLIAKKLGAKNTIARVRDYNYTKQINLMTEALDVTMTINPELEAAMEISRIIGFPSAIKVDTFASGKADLAEFFVPEDSPLIGVTLAELNTKHGQNVLVCAVSRGDEVFIPDGNYAFQARDRIHVTASHENARKFTHKLGLGDEKVKDILIIGGGKITVYLAQVLLKNKYNVKIIERDYNKCLEISELLKNATVVCGNGADQTVLREEGLEECDACISLTGMDEENIIISMYANKLCVKKVVTKVNNSSFAGLLETIDMASVISPHYVTASKIVKYIRSESNKYGDSIKTLYQLVDNKVEALEFVVSSKSRLLDKELKDLKMKSNILIGGIIRDNSFIIPNGSTKILVDDSVIVITTTKGINDLNDILE